MIARWLFCDTYPIKITHSEADSKCYNDRLNSVQLYSASSITAEFISSFLDEVIATLGEGAFGKVVECIDHHMYVSCFLKSITNWNVFIWW